MSGKTRRVGQRRLILSSIGRFFDQSRQFLRKVRLGGGIIIVSRPLALISAFLAQIWRQIRQIIAQFRFLVALQSLIISRVLAP